MLGIGNFAEKTAGLSDIHLVQQGGELAELRHALEASMLSWIGWVATGVFATSYLCKRPVTLRRVQAAAAMLWVAYGALIQAAPVIVASAALVSSLGSWKGLGGTACAFPYLLASRPAKVRSREEAGQ